MSESRREQTYAAVDLGSNSFHLAVARREHGELRFLDRIKEMVRLGGGLDRSGRLDKETQDRAIECLARFGQRLRGVPDANIRAVGTQTFRRMRNANAFLMITETALGCPVDIIGGREEARLIYLGVSQGVAGHGRRRLVVDIGGGSTELVIGEGLRPLELESLQFGCVSVTQWYFANGTISPRRWKRALQAVLAEMQELQLRYRETGWESAIGSSGTIRAVAAICQARGWCESNVTRDALDRLRDEAIGCKRIDELQLPGLSDRRQAVFIGGLVLLSACFEALDIREMRISPFALREGVLHDLLGRLDHRDPRDTTVAAFTSRYGVEPDQARRVRSVALDAFRQIAGQHPGAQTQAELLGWATDLHEIGLGVSHSSYQIHSGYLVRESDMAGFSQTEQEFLATLVQHHRRDIPKDYAERLPSRLHEPLRLALFCLRFACILCRGRDDDAIPRFVIRRDDHRITVELDAGWAMAHPLTVTDLQTERVKLGVTGVTLELALLSPARQA